MGANWDDGLGRASKALTLHAARTSVFVLLFGLLFGQQAGKVTGKLTKNVN